MLDNTPPHYHYSQLRAVFICDWKVKAFAITLWSYPILLNLCLKLQKHRQINMLSWVIVLYNETLDYGKNNCLTLYNQMGISLGSFNQFRENSAVSSYIEKIQLVS